MTATFCATSLRWLNGMAPGIAVKDTRADSAASDRWLVNAPIDLIFCAGGGLWLLIACHYMFHWHVQVSNDGRIMAGGSLIGLLGVALLADPHI